ncbi:hypothetical protein [Jiangella ureilytica]|uniref:hypothetical protein n=1 Tax=Jiangella ureilytica TaxID=2530374 RepID=UPI00193CAB0A|nr:hypothetical protein [Jiangella ureilytica]
MTVQSMPPAFHPPATASVSRFVAPGGTLLVVATAAPGTHPNGENGPPWPLTRAEIDAFAQDGLDTVAVEHLDAVPPWHRWRAEFHRGIERP